MDQPGLPGSQFQGQAEDYLVRRVQSLEKAVQQLAAANPFAPMGITPTPDGFTVTGTETVTGALVVNGPETVNGTQTVNGPLNVNGAMAVTGTLSLPAGIVNNDALASPVSPGSAGLSDPGHAYTTTSTVYAQQSITVPAGFTQALVFLGVSAGAWNNTAAYDYIYVAGDINGSAGGSTPQGAAGSSYGSASAFAIRTLTGLSGGSITVGCRVWTQTAGWAASGANIANTNAIVQFLR
jgi:hypothetical protein